MHAWRQALLKAISLIGRCTRRNLKALLQQDIVHTLIGCLSDEVPVNVCRAPRIDPAYPWSDSRTCVGAEKMGRARPVLPAGRTRPTACHRRRVSRPEGACIDRCCACMQLGVFTCARGIAQDTLLSIAAEDSWKGEWAHNEATELLQMLWADQRTDALDPEGSLGRRVLRAPLQRSGVMKQDTPGTDQ